jgi:hypothetical protein
VEKGHTLPDEYKQCIHQHAFYAKGLFIREKFQGYRSKLSTHHIRQLLTHHVCVSCGKMADLERQEPIINTPPHLSRQSNANS